MENESVQLEGAASEQAPSLTREQVIAEVTNDPKLSKGKFTLGGRQFTVVSLSYKQYLQFLSKLEPVLKMVAGKVRNSLSDAAAHSSRSVEIPGLILTTLRDIDPSYLMKFCADDLPAMVEIVCNMEALKADNASALVTAKWVEDVAESPFQLIDIILSQVNKNNMIVQFASFFAQVLPIFLGRAKAPDPAK